MSGVQSNGMPVYFVELDTDSGIESNYAPGAIPPVTLSVVTHNRRSLGEAFQSDTANLVISLDWQAAKAIYAGIREIARQRGLPLPEGDEAPT